MGGVLPCGGRGGAGRGTRGPPRAFGTIDGPQTVPASELAALVWALKVTKGPIELWSDCALVFDGWCKGFASAQQGPLIRWWSRVRAALQSRGEGQ
eukprot:6057478-Pyramimonas_sp.AAC.1